LSYSKEGRVSLEGGHRDVISSRHWAESSLTWYLVKRVLQTPVKSIIPTKNGMMAFAGIMVDAMVTVVRQRQRQRRRLLTRNRREMLAKR
jgi:hypothetical protein